MSNEKFFSENESNDWELLLDLNEKTHIFDELTPSIRKHHTDGTGYTITKLGTTKEWNIELKSRNLILTDNGKISGCTDKGAFIDDTIFIESHKAADMFFDQIEGLIPLYVNFLADGSTVIYNLSNLKKRPVKTGTMNIRSKGYNKFEIAKRQGLFLSDAAIFDKDGNLIKRAGEEWKK